MSVNPGFLLTVCLSTVMLLPVGLKAASGHKNYLLHWTIISKKYCEVVSSSFCSSLLTTTMTVHRNLLPLNAAMIEWQLKRGRRSFDVSYDLCRFERNLPFFLRVSTFGAVVVRSGWRGECFFGTVGCSNSVPNSSILRRIWYLLECKI